MKTVIIFFSALLLSQSIPGNTENGNNTVLDSTEHLIGQWTIDLRPTKDAVPYYQKFEVSSINGKSFSGTFYGSNISDAKLNTNWDRLYFAFTTYDSSNSYYHSGYLKDGKIYGITYCPNRDMASPWTGQKKN